MKRKLITMGLLTGLIIMLSGCASIVSKSSYPFSINSYPSEAKIIITNNNSYEIFSGTTPATIKLRASDGYFTKAQYQVKFTKEGYETKTVPVYFKLDGWYFGNIIFGGLIGLLIVDPATGAMYKIDTEFLNETLTPVTNLASTEELRIYTLKEVPEEWKQHLVSLSE
ncbi:hypothetical protein [Draconibacterium orientale]|uniref:Signal peptide protein n=2 Tax=Draconibacterium orientale TaxID=1168034 RepID=A0ABN4CV38_9BACT|nr:hypothetical protein [Draconibacterium orientale]AHW58864.1 signal peptide protein [Draconibacterium orientale]